MTEPRTRTQVASDGYQIHVGVWPAQGVLRGRVVALHGIQSHGGWYEGLGRRLAEAGYETSMPDRRGSGANRMDRGHTPSPRRLLDDLAEWLATLRAEDPPAPLVLAGISWGGKLAALAAARYPDRVDALALICPGLFPQVGVSRRERWQIALAWLTNRRKPFPIPLNDPALFTANLEAQAFIASDVYSLRVATAGLLAASVRIDQWVRRCAHQIKQPTLLMLAGQDRIVDNTRTRAYFERIASPARKLIEYPDAHHTLEFEPDPARYARDVIQWLDQTWDGRKQDARVVL